MTDTQKRKFAIAHVGPDGRVALCEIFGGVIKANSWKEARASVSKADLAERPGYGVEATEGWNG